MGVSGSESKGKDTQNDGSEIAYSKVSEVNIILLTEVERGAIGGVDIAASDSPPRGCAGQRQDAAASWNATRY